MQESLNLENPSNHVLFHWMVDRSLALNVLLHHPRHFGYTQVWI